MRFGRKLWYADQVVAHPNPPKETATPDLTRLSRPNASRQPSLPRAENRVRHFQYLHGVPARLGVFEHCRGHSTVYCRSLHEAISSVNDGRLFGMSPVVDSDDLIDAQEVATLIGLSHRNSVATYQRRYPDMPRPVVERSGGHTKLWSRSAILTWARNRTR